MTSPTDSVDIHDWFTDRIAAYLADGLGSDEQVRFETHGSECAACAGALTGARTVDLDVRNLFKDIQPTADFEDRIIQNLRRAPVHRKISLPRMSIHPMVARAAATAAAAMVLAAVGYVGSQALETGRLNVASQRVFYNPLIGQISPPNSATPGTLAYTYANPYPDPSGLVGGYKLVQGLDPTFVVAADLNPVSAPAEGRDDNIVGHSAGDAGASRAQPYVGPTLDKDALQKAQVLKLGLDQTESMLTQSRSHQSAGAAYFKPRQFAAAQPPVDASGGSPGAVPNVGEAVVSAAAQPAPIATVATPAPDPSRKIIRHGELSFEIDSFDSAFVQISKIAAEEGGFIDSTNSEKLDNGKVSGVVTVRLPPEHLDTLILKLRGLGDLKGQKIAADDVTKQYTDLQSELRAASAMEERLLEIIKTGKGDVKELVLAEREAGVWREKVEKITGEINYYNNVISLSTLQISLMERDIRQAALAKETETVDMGVETLDVEKSRDAALLAVDAAGGHIIQSDLKQFEAGQMAATIVAQVSPKSVGPVIDRLKQLGHVARLDASRRQTTDNGAPVPPGVKVHREDTQLQISLYNLANIAPRETTNIYLACDDVEAAYHNILDHVIDAGGRVVDSNLNRSTPESVNGTINFETPSEKSDGLLSDVRGLGQVLRLSVAENPDVANVTSAKRGFALTLVSLATIPPRQTTIVSINVTNPEKDAADLQAAAISAGGRLVEQTLTKTDRMQAHIVFDVPLKAAADLLDRARSSGTLTGIQQTKNPQAPDADSARSRLELTLTGESEIVGQDTGVWSSFKSGLGASIRGLAWSLELVVIGLCLVLPWAALLWLGWKLIGRFRRRSPLTVTA